MKNPKALLFLLLLLIMAVPGLHASSIATRTVDWLKGYGLSPAFILLLISMLPVIELRGSIPVGILLFNMPWQEVVLISIIGNMLPIPFILLFIEQVLHFISRWKIGKSFTAWLYRRAQNKGDVIKRFEAIGLIIFVGIPLPGTGGWTGSFAAKIFGIRFWQSMLYVFLGVLVAAAIVTSLVLSGKMAMG